MVSLSNFCPTYPHLDITLCSCSFQGVPRERFPCVPPRADGGLRKYLVCMGTVGYLSRRSFDVLIKRRRSITSIDEIRLSPSPTDTTCAFFHTYLTLDEIRPFLSFLPLVLFRLRLTYPTQLVRYFNYFHNSHHFLLVHDGHRFPHHPLPLTIHGPYVACSPPSHHLSLQLLVVEDGSERGVVLFTISKGKRLFQPLMNGERRR